MIAFFNFYSVNTLSGRRRIKWFSQFLQLSLLLPLLLWAEPNFTIAKRAEKLFYEKLYGDAIPLYSQLFSLTQDKELKKQWALRLAACHLEAGQPQTTLDLLSSLSISSYRNQTLFLMSLAYRQLDQFPQALYLLQQCAAPKEACNNNLNDLIVRKLSWLSDRKWKNIKSIWPHLRLFNQGALVQSNRLNYCCILPNYERAANLIALEQGYHFMQMGDFANAQRVLSSISWQSTDPLPHELAQLQLAKIFLTKHDYPETLKILTLLAPHLPQEHPLNIERVYLKGWTLLAQQQESQAILCFEELLPQALSSNANWSVKVLNSLIASYLRQAIKENDRDQLNHLFLKSDHLLHELIKRDSSEASYLLLSDFYLIKAKSLSDPHSYVQAQQLLNQSELFSSPEGLRIAWLKRAAAAPSYQERSQLYEQLITQSGLPSSFYARAWFLKGLNDLEEGLRNSKQASEQNTEPFEQAVHAFRQAIQLETHSTLAHKYLAIAYIHLSNTSSIRLAWQTLDQLIANNTLLSQFEYPEEMYCLAAWTALRLNDKEILNKSRLLLQQKQAKTPFWQERYLKLEGFICMQLEEWQQADLIFDRLLQERSYLSSHGEAWFWRAYCASQQHQEVSKREFFQQAYTQDPQSPYAPLAYFYFYSYRDYMQEKRKAIKHLQAMPLLFPNHPLLISAYYLIGLHHKRDYLSAEGQVIRRKDLTTAIDAFQLAESTFDSLFGKNSIPASDLSYFTHIRYQSQLERAQANLAIAQSSTGGKRQIYLEYAEEVFKQLTQDFNHLQSLAKKVLVQPHTPYPKIWAEAELQLAKTYEEKNDQQKADKTLNLSLEHYQNAQITQGYGLMRAWYAKGKLAQQQANPGIALHCFLEAEKATKELSVLSPSEKLDLWIQQSICYKELNKFKQSMRTLSRVINADVISPLRIKAMFLRAEIYELQGQPELAVKQLEATAQKGGEWAQKAKQKLERIYGY